MPNLDFDEVANRVLAHIRAPEPKPFLVVYIKFDIEDLENVFVMREYESADDAQHPMLIAPHLRTSAFAAADFAERFLS